MIPPLWQEATEGFNLRHTRQHSSQAGYRTALSLHAFVRVNERMRVNGKEISDSDYATAFTDVLRRGTPDHQKKLEGPPTF